MPTSIQAQLIEGPGMGLVTHLDPRHVPDQAWVNGRNIRFPTGGSRIQKTDGYSGLDSTPGNEHIRALWHYLSPEGNEAFVRITTHHVYGSFGSGIFEISDVNWPVATLDDVVTVAGYKDYMIWADGKTRVMRWNGGGKASTLFPGELPNGKIVELHKDHLLLANITEPQKQPWRVMYSKVGDPRDMDDPEEGTAGDLDFLDDNFPIVCVKVLGDVAIVHKPNRVYRMVYVGAPNQYQPEGIPSDDGAISARAAITVGSFQYYMGRTNFYRLSSFTEPIGDAIWPEVTANIDWNKAHRIYVYRHFDHDEICWKVHQRDGRQLTAVYNFRDQTWSLVDHDPGTCFGEFLSSTMFGSRQASLPQVFGIFGQENGHIQVYDGARNANGLPFHAWVESKHFVPAGGLMPTKILAIPLFASGTGFLTVQLRAAMEMRQPLPPWQSPLNVHPSLIYMLSPQRTRPWLDVREYGRIWQIRIESGSLNDHWEITTYGTAVIPGAFAR